MGERVRERESGGREAPRYWGIPNGKELVHCVPLQLSRCMSLLAWPPCCEKWSHDDKSISSPPAGSLEQNWREFHFIARQPWPLGL